MLLERTIGIFRKDLSNLTLLKQKIRRKDPKIVQDLKNKYGTNEYVSIAVENLKQKITVTL